MRFSSIIADVIVNQDTATLEPQALYGPPSADTVNVGPILAISAICIGVVVGIILIVKKSIKKSIKEPIKEKNFDGVQVLYGPPRTRIRKKTTKPPEDLYGCPRPEEMEIESGESVDEKNK